MLDKTRLIYSVLINYILIIVCLQSECSCQWINEQKVINESSVNRQPVIHTRRFSKQYIMSDNLNNHQMSSLFQPKNRETRSDTSLVYSDLNEFGRYDEKFHSSDNRDSNKVDETKVNLIGEGLSIDDLMRSDEQAESAKIDEKMNKANKDYLVESSNNYNSIDEKKERNRKNLIYSPDLGMIVGVEDEKKCENISIKSSPSKTSNQFSSNLLAIHDFNPVNNNTGYSVKSRDISAQHRSNDAINYKTANNFDEDPYYLNGQRTFHYQSSRFMPNLLGRRINILQQATALDSLNKLMNLRIAEKRLEKQQVQKRLDIEPFYSEEDDTKNASEDSGVDNVLKTEQILNQESENGDCDLEYGKAFDENAEKILDENLNKSVEPKFDGDPNKEYQMNSFNQIHQHIQSQIRQQNYNQKLDRLINQYLHNQRKQQSKRKNNQKNIGHYYLQHLHNYPPSTKYIPLRDPHPMRHTALENREDRPQSKNQLNLDSRSLPDSLMNSYSFLASKPHLNDANLPFSWYLRKQKPKYVDDSYYRKMLWLKKHNLLSSFLGGHKNGKPLKMINHELQPDSSDDLYSYSQVGELELNDYDSELASPQTQSMASIMNIPNYQNMMGYYTNAYRYVPTLMPNYNTYTPMPTPMAATMPAPVPMQPNYMPLDPYRYQMPQQAYRYPIDDHHKHTDHHHEHSYAPMPTQTYPMHPPTFNHIVRSHKKGDLKDMIWPLLFAVVLPLTFGALLLPLTLMFLVNLFMLLQILRNPNGDITTDTDSSALAKIAKYKSGFLSLLPDSRTDRTNTTTSLDHKNQRKVRFKRGLNQRPIKNHKIKRRTMKSSFLDRQKLNESHLHLLTALIRFHNLFNSPNDEYLHLKKY